MISKIMLLKYFVRIQYLHSIFLAYCRVLLQPQFHTQSLIIILAHVELPHSPTLCDNHVFAASNKSGVLDTFIQY